MKEQGGKDRWPHDYQEIKHDVEIMTIDKKESEQGKGINIGFCFLPVQVE